MSIDLVPRLSPFGDNESRDTDAALPAVAATASIDTVLDCLFRVGVENGTYVEVDAVKRRNLLGDGLILLERLVGIAAEFHLRARVARLNWAGLVKALANQAVILILENRNAVIVRGIRQEGSDAVAVTDPLHPDEDVFFVDRELLHDAWKGTALLVAPLPQRSEDAPTFGFSWFARKLLSERTLMRDVAVAALVMHVIGLSVPIFFQILVDKVVPNQTFATLYTITAGVGVLILFDGAFNYLRHYLLAYVTRKVDHSVAIETIDHLLKLPIDYFQANPSGVTAYKVQEANNIREFLAGRLFNTFLDFLAVAIYVPILLIYSWRLTLIVLGVSGIAFATLAIMSREFRLKMRDVNEIEGRRKAFLFEILNGIATIKALALEPRSMLKWRHYSDEAAARTLSLDHTAARARSVITSMERGMSIGIGAMGALFVLNDQMTVGALVAFNMLGLRLAQPLISASTLMQDYQKALLSVKLLGQLMRTKPEPSGGQLAPKIEGRIEFEDVTFHYPGSAR